MKLNVAQYSPGAISETLTEEVLELIKPEHWYLDETRNRMDNLQETQSIILRYFDNYTSSRLPDYKNHIEDKEIYNVYRETIEKIKVELKKHYDFSNYMVFLAKLLPKSQVGFHVDTGRFLEACHRIHIPLKTNDQVLYIIENVPYKWTKNNIYEFDNTRIHGVTNNSDQERIHLMFNLFP
jgi:hypothetical protein